MKKYQKKYHRIKPNDRWPVGNTKPLSQIVANINKKYDVEIEMLKISHKLFTEGKIKSFDIHCCIDWEKTTLEDAIKDKEIWRRKDIGRTSANYMRRTNTKDNQTYYNTSTKGYYGDEWNSRIRVPSLKRSNRIWRNFYNLFPYLKGEKTYHGLKLKQID